MKITRGFEHIVSDHVAALRQTGDAVQSGCYLQKSTFSPLGSSLYAK